MFDNLLPSIAIVQCHHQRHHLQISFFPLCSAASKNEIAKPTYRYEKVPQSWGRSTPFQDLNF